MEYWPKSDIRGQVVILAPPVESVAYILLDRKLDRDWDGRPDDEGPIGSADADQSRRPRRRPRSGAAERTNRPECPHHHKEARTLRLGGPD